MALIKQRPTPFGVTADYHKIQKVELNCTHQNLVIELAVYASAEARQNSSQPLTVEVINIPFSKLTTDPRSTFYKLLQVLDVNNPVKDSTADADPGIVPQFNIVPWTPSPTGMP